MADEWAICSGDAIDLFVGKETRIHKNIDIAVFGNNRKSLINNFFNNGWCVFDLIKGY